MNNNDTTVKKIGSTSPSIINIKKAINSELLSGAAKSNTTFWKASFCSSIDEMVRSFLNFPKSIPQSFRDQQFARHLLWRIGDNRKYFALIFLEGACASRLDFLWLRLMPYITGELPSEVSTIDSRYMKLSIELFKVLKDYIVLHESSFNELLERIVQAINIARYQEKWGGGEATEL